MISIALAALADATDPAATPWYKVVTGIIAVPTALLGIYAAVQLSRKTRLEMQKLQLEIIEKDTAAIGAPEVVDPATVPNSAVRSPRVIAVSIESYVLFGSFCFMSRRTS